VCVGGGTHIMKHVFLKFTLATIIATQLLQHPFPKITALLYTFHTSLVHYGSDTATLVKHSCVYRRKKRVHWGYIFEASTW